MTRVGRGGFTGSLLTVWCSCCRDWVSEPRGDFCLWCEHRVKPTAAQAQAALQRAAREREDAINARILRMAREGRSGRAIAAAVGLGRHVVRARLAGLQFPTTGTSR
jgi:hypothetical protein